MDWYNTNSVKYLMAALYQAMPFETTKQKRPDLLQIEAFYKYQ